jgi:chemotaxis protein MotA
LDKATLFGVLLGLGTIFGAIILGGEGAAFFYLPAILIVFGGTLAGTLIKFSFHQVANSMKLAIMTFRRPRDEVRDLITISVELSKLARTQSILALEDVEIPNAFYRKAVQLTVDGVEPDVIKQVLGDEKELSIQRHEIGQKVFRSIGEQAPAFGMIGTLVGLVQMLGNLENPESVGPGMAVALLTTLYGAIFAQLVALPIADNLEMRAESEAVNKSLIIDAIGCIHQGYNPRMVEEVLSTYLPSNRRVAEPAPEREQGAAAEGAAKGS